MCRRRQQIADELGGQPRRQRHQAGEACRVTQRDLVGDESALAEAGKQQPTLVDRIAFRRGGDEIAHSTAHAFDFARIDRQPARKIEPSITVEAGRDFEREGALRTDDQCFAVVQERSETEKIVRVRAPTV